MDTRRYNDNISSIIPVMVNMKSLGMRFSDNKVEDMKVLCQEQYIDITLSRKERKLFTSNNSSNFICEIIITDTFTNKITTIRCDEITMSRFIDQSYYTQSYKQATIFNFPNMSIYTSINPQGNFVLKVYDTFQNNTNFQIITFTPDQFELFIDSCYFMFLIDIDEGDMTSFFSQPQMIEGNII